MVSDFIFHLRDNLTYLRDVKTTNRHRHTWGKFWRSTKVTCQYPDQTGIRKRIQGRDAITLHMSQDNQKLFGGIIPVGSGSLQ